MKRFLILLCLLFVFCSSSVFAIDTENDTTADSLHLSPFDAVLPLENIRVGFYYINGTHMMDAAGNKSGYGYDYLQQLLLYTNWKYTYVGYDKNINEMKAMLLDGSIDLLATMIKTPEEEQFFDFSKRSIAKTSSMLLVKDNSEFPCIPRRYETYNGMRIGFLNGSQQNARFAEFAQKHNITYQPFFFESAVACEAALQASKIDGLVTASMRIVEHTRPLETFNEQLIHIAVKKGNKKLLKQINSALDQLALYHPDLSITLFKKYYGRQINGNLFFTNQEQNFIDYCVKNNIVFKVDAIDGMNPYTFKHDGKYSGLLVDVAAEILNRTGLPFEFLTDEERAVQKPAVCLTEIFSYNKAQKYGYNLLRPYYEVEFGCVTRKDFSGIPKKIAMVVSDVHLTSEYMPVKKEQTFIECQTPEVCIQHVLDKTCDAAYLPIRTALLFNSQEKGARLQTVIMVNEVVPFSIAVDMTLDSRLTSILDKSSCSISNDDVKRISEKYSISNSNSARLWDVLISNPRLMVLFCLVCAGLPLIVVFIFRGRHVRSVIAAKNIELEHAVAVADVASKAKSDFLSRMSHDIRTPLNGIIGLTNLAESESDIAEIKRNLQGINISGQFLLGLINDILDFSKIESGRVELHYEPYIYEEFLNYINSVITPQFAAKSIQFSFPSVSTWKAIIVDKLRFNQILCNLLSNAAKFTPENGTVSFQMSGTPVDATHVCVDFIVTDSGCGIGPEYQKRLFEPFSQEWSSNDHHQGTGLGLPIAKTLTELMGGTLTIKSKSNNGTQVTVHFDKLEYMTDTKSVNVVHEKRDLQLSGRHVLLVEDHQMNILVARKLLEKQEMIVDVAENGYIGVEKFKASAVHYYDVILMDIRMPVMDGLEATRIIRSLDRSDASTVPIIAMTADVFNTDIQKSFDVGINRHLGKPIVPQLLYETMNALLQ